MKMYEVRIKIPCSDLYGYVRYNSLAEAQSVAKVLADDGEDVEIVEIEAGIDWTSEEDSPNMLEEF